MGSYAQLWLVVNRTGRRTGALGCNTPAAKRAGKMAGLCVFVYACHGRQRSIGSVGLRPIPCNTPNWGSARPPAPSAQVARLAGGYKKDCWHFRPEKCCCQGQALTSNCERRKVAGGKATRKVVHDTGAK